MRQALDFFFRHAVSIIALLIGLFHLINVSGQYVPSTRTVRVFHLMAMLALVFLTRASLSRLQDSLADRLFRLALVFASVACCGWILSRWKDIAMSGGATTPADAWVGFILILLVLEAARRGVGIALSLICLVFFTYPFYSEYLPGVLNSRGYSFSRISEFLTTTSQGVFGVPLGVSATYIIMFSIYGAFLSAFGAGDFFFRLANRLTRGMRAAGAKTAVIFSTLLGMISGSAAGNVAVTGTLTIPMMQKEGYKPHHAGAIEAVVSTGGQIMPPVMGAAAFIMAEIIGTPYSNIMQAALIPALLFFLSLFFVVHLQAMNSGIEPMTQAENDDESTFSILLSGAQYIIPFVTLVVMMINGYSPFKASFISICVLLVAHVIWTRRIDLALVIKSATAITEGAKSVVPITVACAAAGIIAGTLGITGLGSKISGLIIGASGGYTFVALLFTMLTAIILGMGLPTTAAYLILATVVAPALAKVGVPLLTAHLFVFFYGCVSTITPPVALAAYVAGGIAKCDINKVGWTAFRYGLTCYILPFMFFYGPGLLMGGGVVEILTAVISGGFGVFCIACFIVGQMHKPLSTPMRALLGVIGVMLLLQGLATDLIGFVALFAILFVISRSAESTKPVVSTL